MKEGQIKDVSSWSREQNEQCPEQKRGSWKDSRHLLGSGAECGKAWDGGPGEDTPQRAPDPGLLEFGPALRAKTQFYRFKRLQWSGFYFRPVSLAERRGRGGGGGPRGDLGGVCCKAGG